MPILLNGGANPEAVTYNGTYLLRVKYGSTVVWEACPEVMGNMSASLGSGGRASASGFVRKSMMRETSYYSATYEGSGVIYLKTSRTYTGWNYSNAAIGGVVLTELDPVSWSGFPDGWSFGPTKGVYGMYFGSVSVAMRVGGTTVPTDLDVWVSKASEHAAGSRVILEVADRASFIAACAAISPTWYAYVPPLDFTIIGDAAMNLQKRP